MMFLLRRDQRERFREISQLPRKKETFPEPTNRASELIRRFGRLLKSCPREERDKAAASERATLQRGPCPIRGGSPPPRSDLHSFDSSCEAPFACSYHSACSAKDASTTTPKIFGSLIPSTRASTPSAGVFDRPQRPDSISFAVNSRANPGVRLCLLSPKPKRRS